jgi:hypothetical protein
MACWIRRDLNLYPIIEKKKMKSIDVEYQVETLVKKRLSMTKF